jgi:hypothetical protein
MTFHSNKEEILAETIEEWPDVIGETESREEFNRIVEAVGELTSAVLDCKVKGIMSSDVAKPLRDFLTSVLANLEEGIDW